MIGFSEWTRQILERMEAVTEEQLQEVMPRGEMKRDGKIVLPQLPQEHQKLYCLMRQKRAEAIHLSAEMAFYSDKDKIAELNLQFQFIQDEFKIIKDLFFLLLRRHCASKMAEHNIGDSNTIEVIKDWQVIAWSDDPRSPVHDLFRLFNRDIPSDEIGGESLSEMEEDSFDALAQR